MAAPSFVAASTGATDATGPWTATGVVPSAVGNLIILHVLIDGASTTLGMTSATNIEDLAGNDNNWTNIKVDPAGANLPAGDMGSPVAARQAIYAGRAINTSGAPTFTGTNAAGDDLYFRMYEFTNVATGTTQATVVENSTAGNVVNGTAAASNTAADVAVTTLGPDRLALNFVAVNDDNAISAFTGETGGDWTLAVAPYADSGGTDGAIGLQGSYGLAVESLFPGAGGSAVGHTITYQLQAQSFVAPTTGTTDSVYIGVDPGAGSGSPTDDMKVEIRTDTAGSPSTTVLASGTFDGLTKGVWKASLAASLTASTTYWVVVGRTGANNDTNYYGVQAALTAVGTAKRYNGSVWSAGTAFPMGIAMAASGAFTIDGGTGSIVDIDSWGVVGFALIGTTVEGPPPFVPRNPAINFQDPAIV